MKEYKVDKDISAFIFDSYEKAKKHYMSERDLTIALGESVGMHIALLSSEDNFETYETHECVEWELHPTVRVLRLQSDWTIA